MIKLLKLHELKGFQDFGAGACADVDIEINGKKKIARFKISEIHLSALLTSKTVVEGLEKMIEECIESKIQESFEIDNIYYFEFTGSHFKRLDRKLDWSKFTYV